MKLPHCPRRAAARKLTCAIIEPLELRQLLSGGLAFGVAHTLAVGGGPDSLVVADINGDGKPDIATANYNGTISVLFGQSSGQFTPAVTVADGLPAGVAQLTFSSSGDNLIASTGNEVAVFSTFGAKTPQLLESLSLPNDISALGTIDLTGDGKNDLVVGYQNGTTALFGAGESVTFANTPSTTITSSNLNTGAIDSFASADFSPNQPGLVIGDANGNILEASNFAFGTITLTPVLNSAGVTPFVNVMTGNFNGGAEPDIITSTYGGDVTLIPGNADGTFGTPQVITTGFGSGVIGGGVGAFSANGFSEPIFLNSTTGQFSILGSNNTGTLAAPVSFTAGAEPDAIQLADINGDGRPDVITADYYNHGVSVFLNSSTIAPTITSASSASFVTGVNSAFPITSAGFPSASNITVTGALPAGVRIINSANGPAMLTGIPAAGTGGVFNLTLTSTNSVGAGTPQPFTLTVDQPVTFTSPKAAQFAVGVNNTFNVTTAGFPVATLSERGALPAGVTFTSGANGTATLTGIPGVAAGNSFSILLTSGSGVGGAPSQLFTLTVVPGGITSADHATFAVGTLQTFNITTTGFPATAATITETGALPAGVVFKSTGNNSAELAGTPAANTGKTYPITITAKSATFPAYVQVFTLAVNQAPNITSTNHFTFTTGVPAAFTVTTTGFPKPAITQTGSLPTGVTFNASTNQIIGTPAADQGGLFTATLVATNAVSSTAPQIFTITLNEPPAITSPNQDTFTTGAAATFDITATGFPSATLSELGVLPAGIKFVNLGNSSGELIGTPSATSGKTYAIVLDASNGILPLASQQFTLTVDQAPAITSANHATFTHTAGGTFAIKTTGFPAVTVTGSSLPTGVNVTPELGGVFDITDGPGASSPGTSTLTLSASNGIGSDASQVFTLIVT